ncbi:MULTISPECIES: acyl carrier protein [Staphylococcus]|uniref:acyl carrier protein n=1 Tax=Staphylococcus TaxID=1279 RepID=UPI0021A77F4D|nr:phosphopantetheine-binding protein [Staphylococcus epidermidis]MCT1513184.1 phosphopantetheine-binding protein [Staphylococcus epidermidis]
MTLEEIKNIVKQKILVERLELEDDDITAEDIDDDEPIFDEGLGLDSVEALDVVSGIEEEFKINIQDIPEEEVQENFYSVNTLSAFILDQLK